MKLIIGSHVSFMKEKQLIGCVEETLSYGGNAFMFYTGAPQNTNRIKIDKEKVIEAHDLMNKNGIDINNVVVHAPYIINLGNSSNMDAYHFSISFLKQEISRCEELGVNKLILHPGNHTGAGEEKGLQNIVEALNRIITKDQKVYVCIETMAGKGSECGYNFNHLKVILDGMIFPDKIMFCFDTCHLFDAGYDLNDFDTILDEFDHVIGIHKLACIHLNDSKNIRGSKKDRHENIGLGNIGFDTLINVIYNERIKDVPKILETPYVTETPTQDNKIYPPYKFEIDMLKNKKNNPHLLDDIREYYKKTK